MDEGSTSITERLDADSLVEVLHASKADKVLGALASTSRHICSTARSRVPTSLRVWNQQQADLVLHSHEGGRPFPACTQLYVAANTPTSCLLAVGVLNVAQQCTGLQQLQLEYVPGEEEQQQQQEEEEGLQQGLPLRHLTSSLLSGVPALKQLTSLKLSVPAFNATSARLVQQLVQLTSLHLAVTQSPSAAAAAGGEDLSALAGMRSLLELKLDPAPAVPSAASPTKSFLPSSLRTLHLSEGSSAAGMARWVTHLPGCPHLHKLWMGYPYGQQHSSTQPHVVVGLLADHSPQLQELAVFAHPHTDWGGSMAGLPDVALIGQWVPDAALASLTGLQRIFACGYLCVQSSEDWQHLVCLSALTALESVEVMVTPPKQPVGMSLAVLEWTDTFVHLSGHDIGLLLLACPVLQEADFIVGVSAHPAMPGWRAPVVPAGGKGLPRHPTLQNMTLYACSDWGAAAVSEFACLAPVIRGVTSLCVGMWGHSRDSSSSSPGGGLPDLSLCTQVTAFSFYFDDQSESTLPLPQQEHCVAMVAPLVQLQRLVVGDADLLNARAVLVMQHMLPQLSYVKLRHCGLQLPLAAGRPRQQQHVPEGAGPLQQEDHVLAKVRQLLRPGLVLEMEECGG